jgi:hypothetical protein
MRSRWSAENVLTWLAVASMEGAWLTLAYVLLQWAASQPTLPLNVLHFALAVTLGMLVAHVGANLSQARFAASMAAAAVLCAVAGGLIAGIPAPDPGAFIRGLVVAPGSWVLGLAVVRGAVQANPRGNYATEQLFSFVIPGLAIYWILASASGLVHDVAYTTAAFTATLTFVAAGLLAMGLSRLDDLEVDAIDRAARRRWLGLLVGIVGAVLIIGVPLSLVLGVPVSAAAAGVLGPLAPLLIGLFSIMAIPVFWLLDALAGLLGNGGQLAIPSIAAEPTPIGNGPPPLFEPGSGSAPELTWLLIAVLLVGFFVLARVLAVLLRRPTVKTGAAAVDEVRDREQIALPSLPQMPKLHLPRRRAAPRTPAEAYQLALAAVADGPAARAADETPREHATRILPLALGRDMWWLATDYQLDAFASRPLTAPETRRAIERWRRVVRRSRARR